MKKRDSAREGSQKLKIGARKRPFRAGEVAKVGKSDAAKRRFRMGGVAKATLGGQAGVYTCNLPIVYLWWLIQGDRIIEATVI